MEKQKKSLKDFFKSEKSKKILRVGGSILGVIGAGALTAVAGTSVLAQGVVGAVAGMTTEILSEIPEKINSISATNKEIKKEIKEVSLIDFFNGLEDKHTGFLDDLCNDLGIQNKKGETDADKIFDKFFYNLGEPFTIEKVKDFSCVKKYGLSETEILNLTNALTGYKRALVFKLMETQEKDKLVFAHYIAEIVQNNIQCTLNDAFEKTSQKFFLKALTPNYTTISYECPKCKANNAEAPKITEKGIVICNSCGHPFSLMKNDGKYSAYANELYDSLAKKMDVLENALKALKIELKETEKRIIAGVNIHTTEVVDELKIWIESLVKQMIDKVPTNDGGDIIKTVIRQNSNELGETLSRVITSSVYDLKVEVGRDNLDLVEEMKAYVSEQFNQVVENFGKLVKDIIRDGILRDLIKDCLKEVLSENSTSLPKPYSHGLEFKEIDGGYAVVGIGECKDTELIIPDTYNNLPVISIETFAFARCERLKSVIIGANVETIGKAAFQRCENLIYVEFGENAKTIKESAFSNCTSIKTLCFNNITTIESCAFGYCIAIEKINLTNVQSIGEYTFMGCNNIQRIENGEGTVIAKNGFEVGVWKKFSNANYDEKVIDFFKVSQKKIS